MKAPVVALFCLLFLVSCAPQPKKLVFATDATWAPMEFVNEGKVLGGFDIDLVREVARQAGFEVEFTAVAWDGIFAGLDAGRYDAIVSAVSINDERKAKYDFSESYLNAGQVLVVPKGSTPRGLDALKGSPIGVQVGTMGATVAGRVLGGAADLRTYNEIGMAFYDLAAHKIAAVVTDTPVAAQFVLQTPRYQGQFRIVGPSLTEENYGLVVKKGNKELVDLLNAGLAKAKVSGTLDQLEARWLR